MIENDLKDFIIAKNVIRSYKGTKSRVVIPNGIIGIGPGAFYQNDNITSVIMPDSVISVSRKAFSTCSNLRSVRFSKNLKRIGSEAFSYCFGLNTITLYSGVEIIRPRAFSGCHNIKNVYLPDSLKEIGRDAFVKYGLDCIIHTPSGTRAKEFAIFNNFTTDLKNPPKRQYEPVYPNENNLKDPKAIAYFRTGNYGIEDEDIEDDDDFDIEDINASSHLSSESHTTTKTVEVSATEIGESEIEDVEKELEESKNSKEEEKKEEEKKKAKPKKKKKILSEKAKRIIEWSIVGILTLGIIALGVNYFIQYREKEEDFLEALAPEELIIPFNMAYHYAVLNDRVSFNKQIQYLGLDEGSNFGVQIGKAFIDEYLKNGSLEGFFRRFSIIYTYGIKESGFNEKEAGEAVEFIMKTYMTAFEEDFFETLKGISGYYPKNPDALPKNTSYIVKAEAINHQDGSLHTTTKTNKTEYTAYGDFALEKKTEYSYVDEKWEENISLTYFYKETVLKKLPDFYHVLNNDDFAFGLSIDEDDHYIFYFLSDTAARYGEAVQLYDKAKYQEAMVIFEEISGYEDSDDKRISCKYNLAVEQFHSKNYTMAYSLLAEVVAVDDSREAGDLFTKIQDILYEQALDYYNERKYDESNEIFIMIGDYKDSKEKIHVHEYEETVIQASSCKETGLIKKKCYCGKEVTEIIPSSGHDYESYISVEPTCSKEGEETSVCKYCGHVHIEIVPTIEHKYAEATCLSPKICINCEHEEGDPLGHEYADTTICDRCGYDYAENIRVVADCFPFDVESYLWGENHYIVSCNHKVTYNSKSDRMDLVITWKNSDDNALGYGSLTYSLVANIYDNNGVLVKRDRSIYFNQGNATTYVYGVLDNTDYYVELNLYRGNNKVK